jgi:hypothetical protein
MIEQGNIILCPLCGDEYVQPEGPMYMEYRTADTVQCRWYRCNVCNHSWKEDLFSRVGGAVEYLKQQGYYIPDKPEAA